MASPGLSGRRARQGQDQAQIADELYPVVENLLDELDRWFSVSASSALLSSSSARGLDRRPGEHRS
jgi:hypothetical protein